MSQWKGKVTEELKELYIKYAELFDGMSPGGYAELEIGRASCRERV